MFALIVFDCAPLAGRRLRVDCIEMLVLHLMPAFRADPSTLV
jgi:hypothetical protein